MQTWEWYQSSVQEDSVKSNILEQEQTEGEGQDKKKESKLCCQNATLWRRKESSLNLNVSDKKGRY